MAPSPPTVEQPAFYHDIGAWQGDHYDRNAFTAGTVAEVDALVARTGLEAGQRVLDVGCGTGRHLRELRRRGIHGVGLDVSADLVEVAAAHLAADAAAERHDETPADDGPVDDPGDDPGDGPAGASPHEARGSWDVVVGDARHLAPILRDAGLEGSFDVAWSLCHGGFGTDPDGEHDVLDGLAAAVRPGGHVVVTAFHALFAVRHLVDGDAFDPARLVHHQRSEVHGPDHRRRRFDLWSVTHTARDLRTLAGAVGLDVVSIDGAEPGAYAREGIGLDDPELLAVLVRPPRDAAR